MQRVASNIANGRVDLRDMTKTELLQEIYFQFFSTNLTLDNALEMCQQLIDCGINIDPCILWNKLELIHKYNTGWDVDEVAYNSACEKFWEFFIDRNIDFKLSCVPINTRSHEPLCLLFTHERLEIRLKYILHIAQMFNDTVYIKQIVRCFSQAYRDTLIKEFDDLVECGLLDKTKETTLFFEKLLKESIPVKCAV